jgi:hypothetical protein
MTTSATEGPKRQADVATGDLAKDMGLKHEVTADRAPGSVREMLGKLLRGVTGAGSKKR